MPETGLKQAPSKPLPHVNTKGLQKSKPLPALKKGDVFKNDSAHARLGVLQLFGNAQIDGGLVSCAFDGAAKVLAGGLGVQGANLGDNGTGAKVAAAFTKSVGFSGNETIKIFEDKYSEGKAKAGLAGKEITNFEVLKQYLAKTASAVVSKIGEKLNIKIEGTPNWIGIVKKLIAFFASVIAKELGPIADIMTISKGLWKIGESAVHAFQTWAASKVVEWNPGHTKVILNAINVAMAQNAGEGLWHTLKGAGTLTATVLGGIGGAIAKLVLGFVEAVTKMAFRCAEYLRIKSFLADCKQKLENAGHKPFHLNEKVFSSWFSGYATTAPVIACVAINSGMIGSTHNFLNLVGADDPAKAFAVGRKYLDGIKKRAVSYQKDSGFYFTSNNKQIAAALKLAKDYNKPHAVANPVAMKSTVIKAIFTK